MNMSLLGALLESVRGEYWHDGTKPGLVLSQLDDGEVYASIVRYPTPNAANKLVVVSAKGAHLGEALEGLALAWLAHRKCTTTFRKATGLTPGEFARALRTAL